MAVREAKSLLKRVAKEHAKKTTKCACGAKATNIKRAMCKRCYTRWTYQKRHGYHDTQANPLSRICLVERRAIEKINQDAPIIKLWREGHAAQVAATKLGVHRERIRQRLARWGLPTKSPFKPESKYRLLTADEKKARSAARTARVVIEFWQKVDRSNAGGCWPWTGYTWAVNPKYPNNKLPRFSKGGHFGEKPTTYAYRVAYILGKGPIPKGMTVDHICFNPLCCNPAHLQLLTLGQNAARKDPAKIAARRALKVAA